MEEWAAATRESREAECYKRWPAICAAGIIPFGGGREEKRRRRAECADFAIRGAILKGVEKALKDAARGQKQQWRKANGGAAAKDKQEKEDDSAAGIVAAVLDHARNMQEVISCAINADAKKLREACKRDGVSTDRRNKRQPIRVDGEPCTGKRCALRERCEGNLPAKTDTGTCAACRKQEASVAKAAGFEAAIMAGGGGAWRWRLAALGEKKKPVGPAAIAEAIMQGGEAEAQGHMRRSVPRTGGRGAVGESSNWAARQVAESAGVRVKQTRLVGTTWTKAEQDNRAEQANQLCNCGMEAKGRDGWWCERCQKLLKKEAVMATKYTEGVCGGCQQAIADGRQRAATGKVKKPLLKVCRACDGMTCAKHGGGVCGACRVRAAIRTEGAVARWDRVAATGEGNKEAQSKMQEQVRQRAKAKGQPMVDGRAIKVEPGKVSTKLAEEMSKEGQAGKPLEPHAEGRRDEPTDPWDVPEEVQGEVERMWGGGYERGEEVRLHEHLERSGVKAADMDTLKHNTPGGSTVIHGFLRLAGATYGRGTTYIVSAGRVEELRKATRDKREPRTGQVAGENEREASRMAGDSRRRLWLYAVHYDTSRIGHWALWVADRTAQTLTYYDSHGQPAGQEFVPHHTKEVAESQAYVQRHAWQAAGDSSRRNWRVRVAMVPPQGGVECAVRVMLHGLYAIVCGVESETETKDLQCMEGAADAKMRVFVSGCIIRGAIRVPEAWPAGHDGQEVEWRMQRGPGGMMNAGNTCFMAVMVQGWAASGMWRGMCGDGPVTNAVAETVARVAAGRRARSRIQSLKGAMAYIWPQYADGAQHDAVEFGLRVREAVQHERATAGTGRTVMIAERVKCPCGHEGEPVVAESDGMEVERCARLEDAMAETVAEIEYQCASCEKTTVGRKRRWAVSAGEVLEVRVGRFRQGADGATEKDAEFMEYPSAGLVVAGARYELRGVAVHHGANMTSGHYTAYVMREGRWYLANDEDVDQVEEETALQQEAYVLWYCRETAYDETEEAEEPTVEQTEEESAERGATIKGQETMEEAGASAGDGQRQARATETERVRRAGPSWRAVIGVDEQASGEAARKKMRESMWCLSAEDETASEQERNGAKKMMERLMRARKAMVDEERAASGGRRRRWGITEEERSQRAGRRHVPCMAHQCPPTNIRRLPAGTLVEVRGSAEGRRRISLARPGGGGGAWRGIVGQRRNGCGEYNVEGHETRRRGDGPTDLIRAWCQRTVHGCPGRSSP